MTVLKILALTGTFLALLIVGYWSSYEKLLTPCSPDGFPARCYHINQPMCEVMWLKSDKTCRAWLKTFNFSPGHLIGPMLLKCQIAELDKSFSYSRKSTPECDEMSQDLTDWKRRNL